MAKYSIFLDKETEALILHLRMENEKMSRFIQRMIKEVGKIHGLEVETIIQVTKK